MRSTDSSGSRTTLNRTLLMLFCATQGARSYQHFDDYYLKQLDKKRSKIGAKCSLARKLARIAFTLMTNQQSFKKKEIAYS